MVGCAHRLPLAPPDDAAVVFLYGSERKGEFGPCGCELSPRGSLAQVEAYADRLQKQPILKVDAGNWLSDALGEDGRVRADMALSNHELLPVLGEWDALNVTFRDLPFLVETEQSLPSAVSASLRSEEGGFSSFRVVEVGGTKVGITGVSAWGMEHRQPKGWTAMDPILALKEVVPQIEADIVVVLAYETGKDTRRIVREVPGVDLIIEAGGFQETWPILKDDGVFWVRASDGYRWLGELRWGSEKIDRKVRLDERLPQDREIRAREQKVNKEREQVRATLF